MRDHHEHRADAETDRFAPDAGDRLRPTDVEAALEGVGSRLRALRQDRGLTLAQVADATGVSLSTLSRLESGGRRPTLELLLPLAREYQVPLDELVDAPATGDPRVFARPFERHGRTFVPLTRRADGARAYKIVIPPDPAPATPPLQVHDGWEWLYVLSGRLRLLLGTHDLTLDPGEVAEFDTRTPHALVNPGPEPVELLTLFGPQGERLHVRARQRRADGT
ncbi:XRE family transcriptional regulator [Cellulomonas fimi]|uniref:Helix-turn-helix domain protein n=1 Tax=Cellulomonas fimi (strain ATCC 484 / DSM 20113 / JCM 1341 / CCUG 24087 / LMG 16345 / NBRC 15513 / NCIMB 8980 / NCTC 7547 / NRS-133) TaxID=590998 RepID=F4H161_CELFA|nr:helix-turn-helix domain protein [Cellulomonas fimi ATCC 484]NNH05593.1 helix-turn-helix transcriptional regulator [Cellulomonas fimi]VEH36196.1 HTH-type transcriptional regulator PuuR [Cellulomonas fimi]